MPEEFDEFVVAGGVGSEGVGGGDEGVEFAGVEVDDGTVRARSKGLAVMADGTTGTVTYDDIVVRTPLGWRISHRTVTPARNH